MSLIREISNNEFAFELFRPWFFWDHNTIFLTWNNFFPGLNCIYPSDFVPFTRRPLFLIIDSDNSEAFKASLTLCIFYIMSFTYIYHMRSNKYFPLLQLSNYIYIYIKYLFPKFKIVDIKRILKKEMVLDRLMVNRSWGYLGKRGYSWHFLKLVFFFFFFLGGWGWCCLQKPHVKKSLLLLFFKCPNVGLGWSHGGGDWFDGWYSLDGGLGYSLHVGFVCGCFGMIYGWVWCWWYGSQF